LALAERQERTVLSAFATFVGGFTREAAEAVAGADLGVLAALAERSLIQRPPDARVDPATRFTNLSVTMHCAT
jgi:hypothetical protein